MERLCGLAMGVPLAGRAYKHFSCSFYDGGRLLQQCTMLPCDVHAGYRTQARAWFARQWVRGANGLMRLADPLDDGCYTFFGWQAAPMPGGACGGLDLPCGLQGRFAFKAALRRTRALLENEDLRLYYKTGIQAARGALEGVRLVRPRLWQQAPPEAVRLERRISNDGRFLFVRGWWQGNEATGQLA